MLIKQAEGGIGKKFEVAVPIFECIFHFDGRITQFKVAVDNELLEFFPNTYLVSILNGDGERVVTSAGFVLRTCLPDDSRELVTNFSTAVSTSKNLARLMCSTSWLLATKANVPPTPPLSSYEWLEALMRERLTHSIAGSA